MSERRVQTTENQPDRDRREFLRRCGRYAVITPPAVTLMLTATSLPSRAGNTYAKDSVSTALTNLFNNNHALD